MFPWTLDVSRTASYEITLARLSVRPSLSFLKIGSLVFSDIVNHDSWPWYLVTDGARFLKKKKKLTAQIWAKYAKIRPKTSFFCHFLCLVYYFSLKSHSVIACMQQCLTSGKDEILEKKFWASIWAEGVKIGPETRFLANLSSLVH